MEKINNIHTSEQKKRKRSANWDSLEKNLLRSCVAEFVDVIENKNTDTNTNKAKNAAWKKITERFNELNNKPRTIIEIKQQWRIAKSDAKQKFSIYKNARSETGGGPKPPISDPVTSQMIDMIPKEFEVDFNHFDSDGIIVELQDNKKGACEAPIL
ncbi:uncharacterized protein LOC123701795 [Colias croceus]|uniref:uncharacterized protein LOC123701795 n=1 Tax=Colias crocea TaxID=72248 RepID=UPI001E27B0A7|nr:uncharacterized protein LOC123701795 [Colias croceus]